MRLSKFRELMNEEFGTAFAAVIESDLALTEFRDRTAKQLIIDGEDVREIWFAICRANNVPKERWHGINRPKATEQKPENMTRRIK